MRKFSIKILFNNFENRNVYSNVILVYNKKTYANENHTVVQQFSSVCENRILAIFTIRTMENWLSSIFELEKYFKNLVIRFSHMIEFVMESKQVEDATELPRAVST